MYLLLNTRRCSWASPRQAGELPPAIEGAGEDGAGMMLGGQGRREAEGEAFPPR